MRSIRSGRTRLYHFIPGIYYSPLDEEGLLLVVDLDDRGQMGRKLYFQSYSIEFGDEEVVEEENLP